jgi:flavin-dependent dehydrogenase
MAVNPQPQPENPAPIARAPAAATEHCEVLIVGGGPAGSTAAALLAQRGRDVVLLEREHHPRFHIGESLLPANVALFDALGVRDEVERIGMRKYGIEFVSQQQPGPAMVAFAEAWDKSMPYAWQVRRSELDDLLFRHAGRAGARVFEGQRVHAVSFDDDGAVARVTGDDGRTSTWRARILLDASGRDTLLANQLDLKRRNRRHNSTALFGHFAGARRLAGVEEGHITIFWFDHGWFWFIPLADGITSVGAVCWAYHLKSRTKPLTAFFDDTIALCPELQDRLKNATLVDAKVHATGNYSYASAECAGPRWLLLGDAFTFIDPVFSSGVYLAMKSGFAAVDVVEATLDRPRQAAAARRHYERVVGHGPGAFSWFIYRVTNPTMRELLMTPGNPMRCKEAVLSLLAGDIYGRTPIWPTLALFKALYYVQSLARPVRTWRAWRARRFNIRDVGAIAS